MSEVDSELETTAEVAKKVLLNMGQKGIPLTPENYQIWFEYCAGSNESIITDIDKIITQGKSFTAETNKIIYDKHFGKQKEQEILEEIHKETQKILKEVLEKVLSTNDATLKYSEKLKDYTSKLNDVKDILRHTCILSPTRPTESIYKNPDWTGPSPSCKRNLAERIPDPLGGSNLFLASGSHPLYRRARVSGREPGQDTQAGSFLLTAAGAPLSILYRVGGIVVIGGKAWGESLGMGPGSRTRDPTSSHVSFFARMSHVTLILLPGETCGPAPHGTSRTQASSNRRGETRVNSRAFDQTREVQHM